MLHAHSGLRDVDYEVLRRLVSFQTELEDCFPTKSRQETCHGTERGCDVGAAPSEVLQFGKVRKRVTRCCHLCPHNRDAPGGTAKPGCRASLNRPSTSRKKSPMPRIPSGASAWRKASRSCARYRFLMRSNWFRSQVSRETTGANHGHLSCPSTTPITAQWPSSIGGGSIPAQRFGTLPRQLLCRHQSCSKAALSGSVCRLAHSTKMSRPGEP